MPTIQSAKDSILLALTSFMNFLPALVGAIVILVIGWVVSSMLAKLLEKGLLAARFEQAVQRSGISDFIQRTGTRWSGSHIVAELFKWFVRLIFIQAAANLLQMPQVTTILNAIMLFIPKVIIAIAIIVIGSMIARFLAGVVRASISEIGVDNPNLFAKLTQYAVLGLAIIAALNQIDIAKTVVNTLLIGLVSSVALAVGLAFGLGGRDVGTKITESWYERSRSIPRRVGESRVRVPPGQTERSA